MEKKYNYLQKIIAAFNNRSVEWYYASKVEKMIMEFNSLSETDKKNFLENINK